MVLGGMAGYNHLLTMTFSAIREIIGVTEMGRKSPKEAGLATLGTGVTNPIFQLVYIPAHLRYDIKFGY